MRFAAARESPIGWAPMNTLGNNLGFLPSILAIYGLAFFALGLSVAVRAAACRASTIRGRLFGLATYGMAHGAFEWLTLINVIYPTVINQTLLLAVAVA